MFHLPSAFVRTNIDQSIEQKKLRVYLAPDKETKSKIISFKTFKIFWCLAVDPTAGSLMLSLKNALLSRTFLFRLFRSKMKTLHIFSSDIKILLLFIFLILIEKICCGANVQAFKEEAIVPSLRSLKCDWSNFHLVPSSRCSRCSMSQKHELCRVLLTGRLQIKLKKKVRGNVKNLFFRKIRALP